MVFPVASFYLVCTLYHAVPSIITHSTCDCVWWFVSILQCYLLEILAEQNPTEPTPYQSEKKKTRHKYSVKWNEWMNEENRETTRKKSDKKKNKKTAKARERESNWEGENIDKMLNAYILFAIQIESFRNGTNGRAERFCLSSATIQFGFISIRFVWYVYWRIAFRTIVYYTIETSIKSVLHQRYFSLVLLFLFAVASAAFDATTTTVSAALCFCLCICRCCRCVYVANVCRHHCCSAFPIWTNTP